MNITRKKAVFSFFIICGIVVLILLGIKKFVVHVIDINPQQSQTGTEESNILPYAPVNIIKVLESTDADDANIIYDEDNLSVKPKGSALKTSAKSAVLIDAGSKNIIYEQNAYQRLPMASTTKVMATSMILFCHFYRHFFFTLSGVISILAESP